MSFRIGQQLKKIDVMSVPSVVLYTVISKKITIIRRNLLSGTDVACMWKRVSLHEGGCNCLVRVDTSLSAVCLDVDQCRSTSSGGSVGVESLSDAVRRELERDLMVEYQLGARP